MPRQSSIGPIERACEHCGSVFRVWPSSLRERACRFCSNACCIAAHRRSLLERFWEKVDVGGPDECWEWQGNFYHTGYGYLNQGYKHRRAHRLAYEFAHGPIPHGLFVLHSCDNPACCNPAHLRVGTQKDNMSDCAARGRTANQWHRP